MNDFDPATAAHDERVQEHTEVSVRQAEPTDAGTAAALLEALGYPAVESTVRERIAWFRDSAQDRVLVAEADAQLVGFVALSLTPRFSEPGWFSRVTALVVDPSARRRGIARTLVTEAERIAAAEGSSLMQINCGRRPEREAAHSFYVALGYSDQHDHHILYSKRLEK